MRRIARFGLAALAAMAAACSSTTSGGSEGPQLAFQAVADARDYILPDPHATVTPGRGLLQVVTMMTEPAACMVYSARLARSGQTLDVRVTVAQRTQACPIQSSNFTYTAVVANLEPGTYRLMVTHTYPGSDRPDRLVLDEAVQIE